MRIFSVIVFVSVVCAFRFLGYFGRVEPYVPVHVEFKQTLRTARKAKRVCNPHVVFTTFKCPRCSDLRKTIEENTEHVWSKMHGVEFRVLVATKKNEHGVPLLGHMYKTMMRACPSAKTYTYVNGDIIGTSDFVRTIEAVMHVGEFLMVGRRTNVKWEKVYRTKDAGFSFDDHFANGLLFATNAQDYFTVTKHAIDWNSIPPFVIGRAAYDNWLVDHIYHNPSVVLIDATKTVRMVHQTDEEGPTAHGGRMVKSKADRQYNRILGKGQWDHGHTTHAPWETCFDGSGTIVLKNRNFPDSALRTIFQIHVLTMNRALSLKRLLRSLEEARYGRDVVDLYIHIDKSVDNKDCISIAKAFHFSHGRKTVEIASDNQGLRNAWFGAWSPQSFGRERAIVLEDDTEVSPLWYKWLKGAWETYGNRTDLAGISLQRQTLIPMKPHRQMEIVNNHKPFLYRLVGSIGFSPHPRTWMLFMNWLSKIDLETFDVSVEGLVTTDWHRILNKRHMWTQYFIYFCNERDLFTLYVNLPNKKTLVSHMREKGEHYGRTEGQDFALATKVDMNFPQGLRVYGWDGKPIVWKPSDTWTARAFDGEEFILSHADMFEALSAAQSKNALEGHTFNKDANGQFSRMPQLKAYATLVWTKRKEIRTICETGFNGGHSTMLWASIIPTVNVVAFDMCLGSRCDVGQRFFDNLFPNASLQIVRGDSTKSLPEFLKEHHDLCNFISVDGGHFNDVPRLDIENMVRLAKPNAVIVIDDVDKDSQQEYLKTVGVAWWNAVKQGLVRSEKCAECYAKDVVGRTTCTFCIGAVIGTMIGSVLQETVKRMQQRNGFVNFQFLNEGFIEMTKSWICNVRLFPSEILDKTLFVATDMGAYDALTSFNSSLRVVLEPYATPKDLRYGQYAYYDFMLFRTKLLYRMLKQGITVWLTESDAVWVKDPTEIVLKTNGDMVTASDRLPPAKLYSAGFQLLRPTKPTIKVWGKLVDMFERKLRGTKQGTEMNDAGSEQLMLDGLVRQEKNLTLQWLNPENFVCGLYYKHMNDYRDPTVIQNNWIKGNGAKIKRAKEHEHWYVQHGHCM